MTFSGIVGYLPNEIGEGCAFQSQSMPGEGKGAELKAALPVQKREEQPMLLLSWSE